MNRRRSREKRATTPEAGREPSAAPSDPAGRVSSLSAPSEVLPAEVVAQPAPVSVGTVIKHYKLIRKLGQGGMGVVYLARDTKLGRLIAIKLMREYSGRRAERFLAEARATARCQHENIVIIHDVDEHEGHPYMVLEYIEGRTLRDWMAEHEYPSITKTLSTSRALPPLTPPALIAELMIPVARALICAHQMGIVHRDLKPENILLQDAGPIKVLDFGIAMQLQPQLLSTLSEARAALKTGAARGREDVVLGTPLYMSPEQMLAEDIDARADIWAVGIMLYELLTGTHPLAPFSLSRLASVLDFDTPIPSVSEQRPDAGELGAITDRCLKKRRAERVGSAKELASQLEALLPLRHIPDRGGERAGRSKPRGAGGHQGPNARVFPEGFFKKLDTVHLHIDGGSSLSLVEACAQRFNEYEIPTKITRVSRFSKGPQRDELREMYAVHTPGEGTESLEYFTTSLLDANKHDIATVVEETLAALASTKGIVVELERVAAVISDDASEWRPSRLKGFQGAVRFDTRKTFRVEIHYLVDIIKSADDQAEPLSLDSILMISRANDIEVGGWFLFERSDIWAYRSNSFSPRLPECEVLNTKRLRLQKELALEIGCAPSDVKVTVLVEESLGVWKTPAVRLGPFKTVPELAEWEDETRKAAVEPSLRAFWVVTPNFLGDKRDEIQLAMAQNLATGVKYTYFLRSFADLQRWQKFRADLKRKYEHIERAVEQNIAAVLIHAVDPRQPGLEECFIRNPRTDAREGFQLIRGKTGEVNSGLPMPQEKVQHLIDCLEPLEREAQSRQWTWLPITRASRQFQAYVILTDLDDTGPVSAEERFLPQYDLIIADEVSKHGGEVAKSLFDGYVLIFDDEREDKGGRLQQVLKCMDRVAALVMQAGLPQQRILVDHDNVRRVTRSHGYDTVSAAITRGRSLLEKTRWNYVTVSNKIKTRWEELCGGDTSVLFEPGDMQDCWHLTTR